MAGGPRTEFDNPVVEWVDQRLPIFTLMSKEYAQFPTPKNFNYFWNFGAILTVMLVLMIATGVFLAMRYTAHADMAFDSVEYIMRDVNWGWMLRYMHMNGATFFFIAIYIHIYRGLYYGSYKQPRELLWIFGVFIFLLLMATAFMGYTLPWSQMGGWGATVITNLFSSIPLIGDDLVTLLWGGFSVDNPTLKRFFALHYLMPFILFAVVVLHVWSLHVTGSGNPLGIEPKGPQDTVPFHPYYTAKDSYGLVVFLLAYVVVTFWFPNMFAHPAHFVEYDPLVTPPHIVPEWYFLPFYAILRAFTFGMNIYIGLAVLLGAVALWPLYTKKVGDEINLKPVFGLLAAAGIVFALGFLSQIKGEDGTEILSLPFADMLFINAKLMGVLAMFGSVLILLFLPWIDKHPLRSAKFRPLFKPAVLFLVVALFVLGYVGAQLPTGLWTAIGQLATAYYFAFFLVILPFLSHFEPVRELPASIHDAVLAENK